MTRFDVIAPLWQNFKGLVQSVVGLFGIWQNLEPNLAYFYAIRKFFNATSGQ